MNSKLRFMKHMVWIMALLAMLVLHGSIVFASSEDSSAEDKTIGTQEKTPALSDKKLKIISSEKAELSISDADEDPVWKTSNKKVASIKKTSDPCKVVIKAKKAGKAVISAKVGNQTLKCKVRVRYEPKLSISKKTLKAGKSVTLTVSGTVSKPSWSSSDSEIASVKRVSSKKAKVKGIRNGKAVITARVNKKTLKCKIKVKGNAPTVNCILGTKKKGYYYVDSTGTRINDAQINQAIQFVTSCSSSSQSPRKRMLACFKKMCTYTYSWFPDSPCAAVMPAYASHTFSAKIANCWRYGAAMAYVARVLGYDSRVCIGGVTAYRNHYLSNHGWCEVYIDGVWKMIDVSMQKHHTEVNLFLVPRNKYPFTLRCDSVYPMRIRSGRVVWG